MRVNPVEKRNLTERFDILQIMVRAITHLWIVRRLREIFMPYR